MPGRPRKPLGLRLVQGGGRKETLNLSQPVPKKSSQVYDPLPGMSDDASEVWRKWAPVLFWLTDADLPLFELYCIETAAFKAQLRDEGKVNLALGREIGNLLPKLGMTPSSRAKIEGPKSEPASVMDKYRPKIV